MKSAEVIALLRKDGWIEVAQKGSHIQLKHPQKFGTGDGSASQTRHSNRDASQHRKAGRDQVEAGMSNYIGLIHKDAESDYGVSFPDFPGVVTAGATLDDAREMAEEALALHVEGMIEDGEAIPEPASLETVMSDPANRDGVAILVTLKTQAPKAIRINITLPEDVLHTIDAFAEANGLSRSGFLARAARHEIERNAAA